MIGADEAANKVPPWNSRISKSLASMRLLRRRLHRTAPRPKRQCGCRARPRPTRNRHRINPKRCLPRLPEDAIQETREDSSRAPSEEPPQNAGWKTGAKVDSLFRGRDRGGIRPACSDVLGGQEPEKFLIAANDGPVALAPGAIASHRFGMNGARRIESHGGR